MGDKISFDGTISGKRFDKDGNLLTEYNKKSSGVIDLEQIEQNKICIDAQMMTSAMLNFDFKRTLIQEIGEDFPYTTEVCRGETIGNIKGIKKISWQDAESEFESLKQEISLKFLDFKEQEDWQEGLKLFNKVISSGMKIKDERTFKKDCVNISIITRNKISIFFCNDEELEKACEKFKIKIKFVRIATSNTKIIKDFWKNWKKNYSKLKYQKKR